MALPTKQNTYSYSLCNRIVYASLVQVMRDTMYLIKNHLKTVGYTVKGSSTGAAGAMDGVDRWAAATDAGTRNNGAAGAQSWIVLTSTDGHDILFAYNSAQDDIYKIAVSFSGDYIVAGTATHQPTSAANEQALNTYFTPANMPSIIGTTTSGDRIVNVWARTDGKGFRVLVARANAWVAAFGCEKHDAVAYGGGITCSGAHGFFLGSMATFVAGNVTYGALVGAANNGIIRHVVRTSLGANLASCVLSTEAQGASSQTALSDTGQAYAPEMQGGTEYVMKRLGLVSFLASSRGKIANLRDVWIGRSTGAIDGDVYGNREFISLGPNGLVWPWNGTPSVAGTAVVMV